MSTSSKTLFFRKIMRKLMTLFKIAFGWTIIIPLSFLIPKKKNLIIVIGSENGYFRDNSKYTYIELIKNTHFETLFLTQIKSQYYNLKKAGLNLIFFPSFSGILALLRANFIVVDDHNWYKNYKFYLSYFSKKIQLWHGTGIKYVELMNKNEPYNRSTKGKIVSRLSGRFPKYDLITAPSEYFKKIFYEKAFLFKSIKITGYSRNDILLRDKITKMDLLGTDKNNLKKILEIKERRKKLIVYMPTFRDLSSGEFIKNAFNFEKFDSFLDELDAFFVFKMHYYINLKEKYSRSLNRIIFYDSKADIYPILSKTDLLITDYSSVMFDYLFLDKPIIFYIFDYHSYTKKDRGLYIDLKELEIGPIAENFSSLLTEVKKALNSKYDTFKEKRKRVLKLSFKYVDSNSSKRIVDEIIKLQKGSF